MRRRPKRSPRAAPVRRKQAKARLYAFTVHSRSERLAPRSTRRTGRAVETTSVSRATMNTPSEASTRVQVLCGISKYLRVGAGGSGLSPTTNGPAPDRQHSRLASPMALFAVIREAGPAWDRSRAMREQDAWDQHAAFMDGLARDGFIVEGGPLGDGSRALHVVESESDEAVRQRFADDPWEPPGLFRVASV